MEADFAEAGLSAEGELAFGFSELPDCPVWAHVMALPAAKLMTRKLAATRANTMSRPRPRLFASHFMLLLLIEMSSAGIQGRPNAGMMAKKSGEVNIEEEQSGEEPNRQPNGQVGRLAGTRRGRWYAADSPARAVSLRRTRCEGLRPIRPSRGGQVPGRTPVLRAPEGGRDWWPSGEIRYDDPA